MGKYQAVIDALFVDGKLSKASYSVLVKSSDRATGALIKALLNTKFIERV